MTASSALITLAATGVVMAGVMSSSMTTIEELLVALTAMIAAGCCAAVVARTKAWLPTLLSTASAFLSFWLLIDVANFTQYAPILAASLLGLVCLALNHLPKLRDANDTRLHYILGGVGNLSVFFAGVAALLLTLFRLVVDEASWSLLGLLPLQVVVTLLATWLTHETANWKRALLVLAGGQAAAIVFVFSAVSDLLFIQRVELLTTLAGFVVAGIGYYGWYREQESDHRNPAVGWQLAIGGLMSAVPLTLGLVVQRVFGYDHDWEWIAVHEIGVLAIGLVLLASGILTRIKSTTLTGASALVLYVLSLATLIRLPERLQTTSVYMMVGGGLCFAVGVLLSVYRDRLKELPDKVSRGEGVFSIMNWR